MCTLKRWLAARIKTTFIRRLPNELAQDLPQNRRQNAVQSSQAPGSAHGRTTIRQRKAARRIARRLESTSNEPPKPTFMWSKRMQQIPNRMQIYVLTAPIQDVIQHRVVHTNSNHAWARSQAGIQLSAAPSCIWGWFTGIEPPANLQIPKHWQPHQSNLRWRNRIIQRRSLPRTRLLTRQTAQQIQQQSKGQNALLPHPPARPRTPGAPKGQSDTSVQLIQQTQGNPKELTGPNKGIEQNARNKLALVRLEYGCLWIDSFTNKTDNKMTPRREPTPDANMAARCLWFTPPLPSQS